MSIHRRIPENFWKVPENFGVFQRIWEVQRSYREFRVVCGDFWRFLIFAEILDIFRKFSKIFAGFLNSVPKNLGSTKELQRVSSSFWRFLEILEVFRKFSRIFASFCGV